MGDEQAGRAGASLGARPREEPSCCRALVTRACGRDSSLPGRHFDFFLVTAAFLRVTPLPNCSLGARRARGRRGGRGEGRPRQCGRPVCWCRSQSRPSPALSSSIRGRDAAGGGGGVPRPSQRPGRRQLPQSECDACAAALAASARRQQSAPNRQNARAGRRLQRRPICWEKAWGPDSLAIGRSRALTCRQPPSRVTNDWPSAGIALLVPTRPKAAQRPAHRAMRARKMRS